MAAADRDVAPSVLVMVLIHGHHPQSPRTDESTHHPSIVCPKVRVPVRDEEELLEEGLCQLQRSRRPEELRAVMAVPDPDPPLAAVPEMTFDLLAEMAHAEHKIA